MPSQLQQRMAAYRHRASQLLPHGARARQAEKSFIFSADDEARPSDRLVDLALRAARAAHDTDLTHLDARLPAGSPPYASLWPGEHYRLLAGLVREQPARTVVEIGTATGLSALALLHALPADGRVVTFDLVPWREYPGTVLTDEDFADGRLTQHLDDLSTPAGIAAHRELLQDADLVFVDAAKDGEQERRFLELFAGVAFKNAPVLVFDDVRQWKMLAIWRDVHLPKLDLTSFGHWSGTGLVDLAPGAAAQR